MMRKGQVMLMTIMVLGGTILGAITIGGMILVFQLRQTGDLQNSARAVFAADAAIEWGLYQKYHPTEAKTLFGPQFANANTKFEVKCFDAATSTTPLYWEKDFNDTSCADASTQTQMLEGFGQSGSSKRAFRQLIGTP